MKRSLRQFKHYHQYLIFESIMSDPEWKKYKIKYKHTEKFVSIYDENNFISLSKVYDRCWKACSKRRNQYK